MSQEKEKTLLEKAAESQVWKSIFRGGGVPRNRRQRMMSVLNSDAVSELILEFLNRL